MTAGLQIARDLHLKANGYSNLEREVPMKLDDIFWIASMSKPITAAAVMMLVDEGKLSLDDPITKYLPEMASLKTADGKSVFNHAASSTNTYLRHERTSLRECLYFKVAG